MRRAAFVAIGVLLAAAPAGAARATKPVPLSPGPYTCQTQTEQGFADVGGFTIMAKDTYVSAQPRTTGSYRVAGHKIAFQSG